MENPIAIEIPEDLPINQGIIDRKTEESKLLESPGVYASRTEMVLNGSKE